MNHRFTSGGLTLSAYVARPPGGRVGSETRGVVVSHGFPSATIGARAAAASYPELADRVANELGWVVLVPAFRGAADSEGHFSLGGWLEDLLSAVDHLHREAAPGGVWLVGFGTGGALSICAAARDPEIRGVAALAAPADFDDWAHQPRRLLDHARSIGLIRDPAFPPSFDRWARQLREVRAVQCMPQVRPRPVLIVHGTDDESVPAFDARVLADAHASAELRMIGGAGHTLRHDPRAMAVLLGWLDRQRLAPPARSLSTQGR
ncbi:MAG: alpha/beta hydrolase family protein [Acidimicrobiales bacterium]